MPIEPEYPDEFQHLHDVEVAETSAVDLYLDHLETITATMEDNINELLEIKKMCGCCNCRYAYLALWLGHERITRFALDRLKQEEEENDDEQQD